jgi:hypothetical protein
MSARLRVTALAAAAVLPLAVAAARPAAAMASDDLAQPYTVALVGDDNYAPLVSFFGDDEWTDCHRFAQGSGDPDFAQVPLDRLDFPTYDGNGFDAFLTTLRDETQRFDGQVVFVLTFEPELVPGNPHPVNAEVPAPLRLPRLKMDDGLRWGLPEFVDAILSGVFPLSTICLPVPLK